MTPSQNRLCFFVLAVIGSVLMGTAPSLPVAIMGRILMGLGFSTNFVCNFNLLSEWFSTRKFVIMGSIFMAMGGIGALFAGTPLAWKSWARC